MARRSFTKPTDEYDSSYLNYLVNELENLTGLTYSKGERIEINGVDSSEFVLVSPNGTKFKIEVNDLGILSATTTI